MVGFGSVLICTWELLLAYNLCIRPGVLPLIFGFRNLIFSFTNGGISGLFWGYTIVVIGTSLVYASIAEMASMCAYSGTSIGAV